MDSIMLYMNFLEAFAGGHLSDDCVGGVDLESMFCSMESESSLPNIEYLKDKGNTFFKQNYFDKACHCYDKACKLLSFLVATTTNYDYKFFVDLVISLNLNLAARALKAQEHEAARNLCDLVLSFFPQNVKALFRRALAFAKLNMFLEANNDLKKALVIKPNNMDILRELDVVKNHIVKNGNGKRNMKTPDGSDVIRQGKRPFIDVGTSENNVVDECGGSFCESYSNSRKENKPCDLEQPPVNSSAPLDMNIDVEVKQERIDVRLVSFVKKGGRQSRLQIPMITYQKLIDGHELSFYNKYHLSTMKVWVRRVPKDEPMGKVSPPSNRKRRKKRSKKGKSKRDYTTSGALCPSPNIFMSSEDNYGSQQGISISPVDASSLTQQIVPCSSLKNESKVASQTQVPVNLADNHLFCFSSTPKIRRWLRAKKLLPDGNHCHGGLSLRHISSPFSGKFPRSCDVSVSHRRFFFEVQVQRKRKTPPSDKSNSENPPKKPIVIFSYISSLVCNMFNVVVAHDSEGHEANM